MHRGVINQCPTCNTVFNTCLTSENMQQYIQQAHTDTPVSPAPPSKPKVVLKVSDVKYPNVMYVPVRVNEFETLTIFLRQRDTYSIVTSANLISCVLHFKKQI